MPISWRRELAAVFLTLLFLLVIGGKEVVYEMALYILQSMGSKEFWLIAATSFTFVIWVDRRMYSEITSWTEYYRLKILNIRRVKLNDPNFKVSRLWRDEYDVSLKDTNGNTGMARVTWGGNIEQVGFWNPTIRWVSEPLSPEAGDELWDI